MKKEFSLDGFDRRTDLFFTEKDCDLELHLSQKNSYVIVCDENTLEYSPFKEKTLVIESGESNKTWENVMKIINFALSSSTPIRRDSYFVAIGGGVICDMTALACSLYMRGARLILYPTTLLCMVDATLGGKTAVDYGGVKNLIGTFYPADEVIINMKTLISLPQREFLSGLGEVVKHALLSESDELYNTLLEDEEGILERRAEELEKIVKLSLLVKKSYIERDPKEQNGIRSSLNFGHTFGHALESISSYSISHGEAVVWGMKKALTAGLLLGITPEDFYLFAINLISSYPFKANEKVKRSDYISFLDKIKKDKKNIAGKTNFILLKGLGEPIRKTLTDDKILSLVI